MSALPEPEQSSLNDELRYELALAADPRAAVESLLKRLGREAVIDMIWPEVETLLQRRAGDLIRSDRSSWRRSQRGAGVPAGTAPRSVVAIGFWEQRWQPFGVWKCAADLTLNDVEWIIAEYRTNARESTAMAEWFEGVRKIVKRQRVTVLGELRRRGIDLPPMPEA